MKTLLIYGLETVAGGNIATTLRSEFRIVGTALHGTPELHGCQVLSGQAAQTAPHRLMSDANVDYVIDASCCGDSAWNPTADVASDDRCEASIDRAKSAAALNIPFVFLSSDAVLTGPWMFHEEDSTEYSTSVAGQRLKQTEENILAAHAGSLVVRTHPIGWSPCGNGWLEQLTERLQQGKACPELSRPGYATPLLASELATILSRALTENLTGRFHIAGAERINRVQFARRLKENLNLHTFRMQLTEQHFSKAERQSFGCGESSLQTRGIRRALCVAMPTMSESLQTLADQQNNGYVAQLQGQPAPGSYLRAA